MKTTKRSDARRFSEFLVFLLVIVFIELSSCGSSSPSTSSPPDAGTVQPFNSPDRFERLLFPEKRRTRVIGFNGSSTDLDGDGISNQFDPFPLDSAYPGPQFATVSQMNSLAIPLIDGFKSTPSFTLSTYPSGSALSVLRMDGSFTLPGGIWNNLGLCYPPGNVRFFDVPDTSQFVIHSVSMSNKGGGGGDSYQDEIFHNVSDTLIKAGTRLAQSLGAADSMDQMLKVVGTVLLGNENATTNDVVDYFEWETASGSKHEPYFHLDEGQFTSVASNIGLNETFRFWEYFSRDNLIFTTIRDPGTLFYTYDDKKRQ